MTEKPPIIKIVIAGDGGVGKTSFLRAKENLEFLKEFYSGRDILTEPIHRRVRITEAGKLGKTVFEYDEEAANQFFKVLERLVIIGDEQTG